MANLLSRIIQHLKKPALPGQYHVPSGDGTKSTPIYTTEDFHTQPDPPPPSPTHHDPAKEAAKHTPQGK